MVIGDQETIHQQVSLVLNVLAIGWTSLGIAAIDQVKLTERVMGVEVLIIVSDQADVVPTTSRA